MVSFDVTSLFTNIPTDESIDLIVKKAFNKKYTKETLIGKKVIRTYQGLEEKDLKKLLELSIKSSHFVFDKIYYDQIDGVAMGSPLAPTLANIFMADFEEKIMNKLEGLGVKLWYRYVDDVFSLIEDDKNLGKILELLNSQHENIKFTIEKEIKINEHTELPFLDVLITKEKKLWFRYNCV